MTDQVPNRRSSKKTRRRKINPGLPPGTLLVDPSAPKAAIRIMAYGPHGTEEVPIAQVQDIRHYMGKWPVTWIDVVGSADVQTVQELGELLGLHKLALEDVVNTHQRSKVEAYPGYYFIVARMVNFGDGSLEPEQLSMFLSERFVLTFQEKVGDCFDPIRERIRHGKGRIRTVGPDYLTYALLDAITDYYFPVLEVYGERLDALEEEVIHSPKEDSLPNIFRTKRDLLLLRRCLWPLREALSALLREETPLISPETRVFLRDCFDHAIQLQDLLETHREVASGLMEIHMSSLSNRMNEIMKVLTIFSALFIPMTFIAGVYGMNFNTELSPLNMPELNWFWGYPFALMLMVMVALGMFYYFYRKGWIGKS